MPSKPTKRATLGSMRASSHARAGRGRRAGAPDRVGDWARYGTCVPRRGESPVDHVKFYFDPRCPWCYQTSRWANRLEQLGEIELDWGVFSLEVANLPEGGNPRKI